MRQLLAIVGIGLAVLLTAREASSDDVTELRTFNEAGWKGAAYALSDTGRFSHCSVVSTQVSGAVLVFTLHAEYQLRITVGHPNWLFRKGQAVAATLQVDDKDAFSGNGMAFGERTAAFGIDATSANYELFTSGRRLHVLLNGKNYDFFLDGTAKALAKLVNCVDRYADIAAQKIPEPGETKSKAARPQEQDNPTDQQPPGKQASAAAPAPETVDPENRTAQRLEATEIATNVAADAGLEGFRIVNDPQEREKAGNPDVLWVAGNLIGSANIVDDMQDLSIDEIAAARSVQMAGCEKERSTATKRESVDGVVTVTTLIRCVDADDKPILIDTTLIQTRPHIFFEFGFLYVSPESDGAAVGEGSVGANVRDAVLTVLKPQ